MWLVKQRFPFSYILILLNKLIHIDQLYMKKIIILFGILTLGLHGCMKKSDPPVTDYANVPVIVQFSFETMQNMLLLPGNLLLLAPELPSEYGEGAMLWTDFTIDEGNQPYSNYLTVSKLVVHSRINSTDARGVTKEEMSDNFNSPIYQYFANTAIGNVMFFGFTQKAPAGQIFEYEILYDKDSDKSTTPVLYIRSRKVNEVTGSETEVNTMYGFDLSYFLSEFKGTDGYTRFYIKCLTGTKDGEDVYTSVSTEPYVWDMD